VELKRGKDDFKHPLDWRKTLPRVKIDKEIFQHCQKLQNIFRSNEGSLKIHYRIKNSSANQIHYFSNNNKVNF
jgi:hypothetical protein